MKTAIAMLLLSVSDTTVRLSMVITSIRWGYAQVEANQLAHEV